MKATASRSGAPERPKSSGFKQNSLGNLGAGALELLPEEWEWQKQRDYVEITRKTWCIIDEITEPPWTGQTGEGYLLLSGGCCRGRSHRFCEICYKGAIYGSGEGWY